MAEKYNEDIMETLKSEQRAINTKINNLVEFIKNGSLYKDDAKAALKSSISSDSDWQGNKKPVE